MDVRQLMTQPVNYVLPSSRTADVRKLMKQDNVRHYPVCDKGGRLIGILSDRDILASDAKYVSDCMTTNVCTVRSDSKVSPAITMMFNHGISSLPIVDDGKLVGLLTTTDLVMTLQCTLQILQKSEAGLDLQGGTQHTAFPVKFQPPVLKS
jgi:acetoin utilization protein AcuB